jgi:DNA polymerase III epsilon subunit-like protein
MSYASLQPPRHFKPTVSVTPRTVASHPPKPAFSAAAAAPASIPPIVAMDCEMIMVGRRHEIAEIAIVNYNGDALLHEFVRPSGPVTNYLTPYSGITAEKLVGAKSFTNVQKRVLNVLKDKEIVGHALENDFRALRIPQGDYAIYDSAYSPELMKPGPHGPQPDNLKNLVKIHLERDIQLEEHSGLEDAQACMELFRKIGIKYTKRPRITEGGSRKNKRPKKRQTCRRRNVLQKW